MQTTVPLKLASIAFAGAWTCWMVWSTASFDTVGIIILTMCGTVAGIAWYFVMRWLFRLIHLLPRTDTSPRAGVR
jgi:uncharacterized membrane-anchored protein